MLVSFAMRNQIKVTSSAAVALIAHDLKLTEGRVRQIIGALKLKPVQKIGNVPFYSEEQVKLIRQRNRKPGPKSKHKQNGVKK